MHNFAPKQRQFDVLRTSTRQFGVRTEYHLGRRAFATVRNAYRDWKHVIGLLRLTEAVPERTSDKNGNAGAELEGTREAAQRQRERGVWSLPVEHVSCKVNPRVAAHDLGGSRRNFPEHFGTRPAAGPLHFGDVHARAELALQLLARQAGRDSAERKANVARQLEAPGEGGGVETVFREEGQERRWVMLQAWVRVRRGHAYPVRPTTTPVARNFCRAGWVFGGGKDKKKKKKGLDSDRPTHTSPPLATISGADVRKPNYASAPVQGPPPAALRPQGAARAQTQEAGGPVAHGHFVQPMGLHRCATARGGNRDSVGRLRRCVGVRLPAFRSSAPLTVGRAAKPGVSSLWATLFSRLALQLPRLFAEVFWDADETTKSVGGRKERVGEVPAISARSCCAPYGGTARSARLAVETGASASWKALFGPDVRVGELTSAAAPVVDRELLVSGNLPTPSSTSLTRRRRTRTRSRCTDTNYNNRRRQRPHSGASCVVFRESAVAVPPAHFRLTCRLQCL
ncbi:MAG: hypothetical protein BJ554DRAFT_7734 [Olpidium bornovanus]|uniref:Uncharacterized protein n=1 Tax=Olpidium bornovanus TaxID=278681 RepID=A0A8H8DIV3_9FUNG|nr:MAG: hypothetical protein BJ554DRAFT_7734 [Olpidium bornovanus]